MPLRTQYLLEFGEFQLNLGEKVLLRGEDVVPITPKVFETLCVLLEDAGRLIEKDELMQRIWRDRFVEESNLTFNIKMLRKALGDDAAKPRFIETVPRRGYRFIAKVREGAAAPPSRNGSLQPAFEEGIPTASEALPQGWGRRTRTGYRRFSLPLWAVLCLGVIGSGVWLRSGSSHDAGPTILSVAFSSEKLSTNGRVLHAAISPDGKNVAYTNGLGSDKQSVWLRQLETSNNVQIIPPSDEFYYNLAFSPDGNFLYFVRGSKPQAPEEQNAIYRISIFGGIATKIVDAVQGGMSISQDGRRISFVRCYYRDDEWCSLWVAAAADGGDQRKVAWRPRPFRIGDNEISPDGREIAFGSGQSRNGANDYGMYVVDVETGAERELTSEKFFDIKRLAWLPGRQGILFTALKYPDRHIRIWHLRPDSGEAVALTKTSQDYWGLSIDMNVSTLVATEPMPDFRLNVYQADDLTKVRHMPADAATVSFSPDGKLVVSSGRQGNFELWSLSVTETGERQLTNGPMDSFDGRVSADGATVYFASNRTGQTHVWQMKADGSDQSQVTTGEGGIPLAETSDGKWLYYHSSLAKTLRRVSLVDGEEQLVIDEPRSAFVVSPDRSRVMFVETSGDGPLLTIVSLLSGERIASHPAGSEKPTITGAAWSHDGNKIFYVAQAANYTNALWVQPVDKPLPRKLADLPGEGLRNESSFAVSPDGGSFAVIQGTWKRDAILIRGLK